MRLTPAFSDNPFLRLEESEPILMLPEYRLNFNYLYEDLDQNKIWTDSWRLRSPEFTACWFTSGLAIFQRKMTSLEIVASESETTNTEVFGRMS